MYREREKKNRSTIIIIISMKVSADYLSFFFLVFSWAFCSRVFILLYLLGEQQSLKQTHFHTCSHMQTLSHTQTHVHTCANTQTHIHTHKHTETLSHTNMFIHVHLKRHLHIHKHTFIHVHIHILSQIRTWTHKQALNASKHVTSIYQYVSTHAPPSTILVCLSEEFCLHCRCFLLSEFKIFSRGLQCHVQNASRYVSICFVLTTERGGGLRERKREWRERER